MNTILIQHGIGECEELLKITSAHHRAYCDKFKLGYLTSYEDFVSKSNLHPVWNKVYLLKEFLNSWPGIKNIIFLDADTLIKDFSHDFSSILNQDLALLAKHFFNSGVLIMKNTPEIQAFWENLYLEGPVSLTCFGVDSRLTEILTRKDNKIKIQDITSKYNYFEYYKNSKRMVDCEKKDASILAWHGIERKKVKQEMLEILGSI